MTAPTVKRFSGAAAAVHLGLQEREDFRRDVRGGQVLIDQITRRERAAPLGRRQRLPHLLGQVGQIDMRQDFEAVGRAIAGVAADDRRPGRPV